MGSLNCTPEQFTELDRLMEANRKGELEMIRGEESLNRLRKRLDL